LFRWRLEKSQTEGEMVSICEIGSVARRESDVLSDKDLLAVGCSMEVEIAVSDYKKNGWNITHYSKSAFEAMARCHSLFIQHVKQDGQFVRDDQGYLRKILDGYRANKNYTKQLSTAIEPIRSLGEIEPGYWGKLFQADILYVAVRNACILHRASVAEPEFDFRRLIVWVSGTMGLSSSEREALLRLRSLKHAYRARCTTMDVSGISEVATTARKLADYWAQLSCSAVNEQEFSNGYFEVRALEGQLVRAVGPVYMDNLAGCHELAELWSTICNSDPYKPRPPHLQRWSQNVSDFLANQHTH